MKNAYLTVEAALVMPIVLGVVVLIVYLLFFQYDRCLMEQSAGILALRGCTLQAGERKELAEKLYCRSEQMEPPDYLAWHAEQPEISLQGNRVKVKQEGYLKFPFSGLLFQNSGSEWKTGAEYRNQRIQPVVFIRNCRRVTGGK